MTIPGSNLLNQALTIIASQPFTYYAFDSYTVNAVGRKIPAFSTGVDFYGSVQSVDAELMERYGLDWKTKYINVHVSTSVFGPDRGTAGDRVAYEGVNYQVEKEDWWTRQDGWTEFIAVEIQDSPT